MTLTYAQAFVEAFAASGGLYYFAVAVICGLLRNLLRIGQEISVARF